MKKAQFLKNLSLLLVLNLLIKPVWIFFIDREVQNKVGHEAYGTYFSLFNLTYVLLFVADAGLNNMLSQRLAAREGISAQQLFRLKIWLLLLYGAACFLVSSLTGASQGGLLLYLLLVQGLTSLFLFLRGLLAAHQYFRADALFSVVDKLLLTILCAGPAYGIIGEITIPLFLQLQLVSTVTATLLLLFFVLRKKLMTAAPPVPLLTIFRWTAPFVSIILLMSAHSRLDAFLLERLHPQGASQAGIYATAYRLLDAGNVIGYLTASFLLPFVARNQTHQPLIYDTVLLLRQTLLIVATGAVAFVLVFAPWVQQVLYHSQSAYDSQVMRLCLATLPAYYLVHIYGTLLTAAKAFKAFIRLLAFTTLLNIALNLWLIPHLGAAGCCIAALVSQYACGLGLWLVASKRFAFSYAPKTFLLPAGSFALLVLLFYTGHRLTGNVWIILSSIALAVLALLTTQRNVLKKRFSTLYP